ncbi:MAG TPA: hypothetical protein VL096_18390, partial [Pirellulaceae bacterium]|nr:hypothetical protein [Pirellulaceae bacterium]
MRQIGTLNSADEAERFTAYLLTQEIPAQAEAEGDAFVIWVKNEDQLPVAKDAIEQFRTNPRDPRYANAQAVAAAKLREQQTRREQARKNVVELRGRWQTGSGGGFKQAPLTYVLIGLTLFVAYLT